jgi:hypothetical protein
MGQLILLRLLYLFLGAYFSYRATDRRADKRRDSMKISFTRDEVKDIILAHVHRAITTSVNTVDLASSYYSGEYATVTYEEPARDSARI